MPILSPSKGMSKGEQQAYISSVIAAELRSWRRTGKVGNSHPKNSEEAQAQASAIAYARLREAGYKVPVR